VSYTILSVDGFEPVSLESAKNHLRVDIRDDDDMIEEYISAARSHCERFTGLAFVEQSIRLTAKKAKSIELPLSPVADIVSVLNGADPVAYAADLDSVPAVLTFENAPDSFTVTYRTGLSKVNPTVKVAILMMVHQMYEHRGEVPQNAIERVEEAYLRPMRVNLGMA
jgi:uncharacterized phiE125 gp8 family phage protein